MNRSAPNIVQNDLATGLEGNREYCRTILVADDDPVFRRLMESNLERWGYKIMLVDNGIAAWDILRQGRPVVDLVILDWLMPGIDGIDLCRRIREERAKAYQYILLISGKDDKQNFVAGVEAGADDYPIKPFDTGELRARLRAGVRILALKHDLVLAREQLRYQAMHDALTGLWSHAPILELLAAELHRAARGGTPTGILIIDLDHFKRINDTYGHITGDAALKEVAQRISQCVRSYDFVGRYGGEEFIAVLSNCSGDRLRSIAERVRSEVGATPVIKSPQNVVITA